MSKPCCFTDTAANQASDRYILHIRAVTGTGGEVSRHFEVDRGAFFGRGADPSCPAALITPNSERLDTVATSVDPCMAIMLTLKIAPRSAVECAFLSSVGDNRAIALEQLQSFRSLERIDWAVEAASLHSERELTAMRVDSAEVQASFRLLASLMWPRRIPHIGDNAFEEVRRVQDTLWRHGISGDRPIITVNFDREAALAPAEVLLGSIAYLGRKGFALDAVFLDQTKGGYTFPTNERLRKLVEERLPTRSDPGHSSVFIVPARNLSVEEVSGLVAAARLYIESGDSAATTVRTGVFQVPMPDFVPQPSSPLSGGAIAPVSQRGDLKLGGTVGGLLPDLDGYSMLISDEIQTPAPWCNVLANPGFGTLVSESGSMCTWWRNSSEYRLTPWSNDPVHDGTGEAIYVRDEETAAYWSVTPGPRSGGAAYRVTHGIGESLFEHNSHGLDQRLQIFVDPEYPVKILRIRLANKWPRNRRITVTYAVEWTLGNAHSFDRHLRFPERDGETGALLVRNGFAPQWRRRAGLCRVGCAGTWRKL